MVTGLCLGRNSAPYRVRPGIRWVECPLTHRLECSRVVPEHRSAPSPSDNGPGIMVSTVGRFSFLLIIDGWFVHKEASGQKMISFICKVKEWFAMFRYINQANKCNNFSSFKSVRAVVMEEKKEGSEVGSVLSQ